MWVFLNRLKKHTPLIARIALTSSKLNEITSNLLHQLSICFAHCISFALFNYNFLIPQQLFKLYSLILPQKANQRQKPSFWRLETILKRFPVKFWSSEGRFSTNGVYKGVYYKLRILCIFQGDLVSALYETESFVRLDFTPPARAHRYFRFILSCVYVSTYCCIVKTRVLVPSLTYSKFNSV